MCKFYRKGVKFTDKKCAKNEKKVNCLYGPTYDYVICVTSPTCTYHFGECPQN